MEFMDAGSVDKLQEGGIPEGVLARVAHSMVRGLKFLKDEMQIIHRGPYRTRLPDSASLTLTCFHLSRRKTNERPSKQARRREALRFRCLWSAGEIARKDEHWMSIIHGRKFTSFILFEPLSTSTFVSLSVSRGSRRTILAHILFPRTCGHSGFQ